MCRVRAAGNKVNDSAIEYEPRLIEEAVLRAVENTGDASEFRRGRDPLYTIEDPAQREAAFQAFHARWFARLRIAQPLLQVLAELSLLERVDRCAAMAARTSADEGAELFVAAPELGERRGPMRSIVIRLRPEILLDRPAVVALLGDELMHVADMLDPDFGYEPSLPLVDGDPAARRLLLDRVRVLWNTAIAGRLARRGHLTADARRRRYSQFIQTFSMLGDEGANAFAAFFNEGPYRWRELLSFAQRPAIAGGQSVRTNCPLCGGLLAASDCGGTLARRVRGLIQRDFPAWRAAEGICAQCAELYRARERLTTGCAADAEEEAPRR